MASNEKTINKYLKQNSTLADVGTGAGFPGIPLKIVRPDLKITLVDSLNKRINFLNEVKNSLKLDNLSAVHSRAEDLARTKEHRESYELRILEKINSIGKSLIMLRQERLQI